MTSVNVNVPASARQGCIAIGNFDGVHRGHAAMLKSLLQLSHEAGTSAVAVTFDPHPITILRPEFSPPVLTTLKQRITLLRNHGADEVVVMPVTPELLQMSAEHFFADVVVQQFQAKGIVEGPNFRFGKDRLGEVELLKQLCHRDNLLCRIVDPLNTDGQMISSSRIRELLCNRAMKHAIELLGHPYCLTGTVRRGAGRGRTIGFPTANLANVQTLLPAHGVYAGVTTLDGSRFPVAVSVGPNPTFGEHREKIECHIHGFSGDLYDTSLDVELLAEVRALESFGSIEELVNQIRADVETCCRIAAGR